MTDKKKMYIRRVKVDIDRTMSVCMCALISNEI